ncbi:hypothetical protein K474DRAFT_1706398 [Panus rudis PR-1116 ss-1]|nr:hypothetical protein K474DRAFT_1706398 [Panus rudis PR-1116 ss-1]
MNPSNLRPNPPLFQASQNTTPSSQAAGGIGNPSDFIAQLSPEDRIQLFSTLYTQMSSAQPASSAVPEVGTSVTRFAQSTSAQPPQHSTPSSLGSTTSAYSSQPPHGTSSQPSQLGPAHHARSLSSSAAAGTPQSLHPPHPRISDPTLAGSARSPSSQVQSDNHGHAGHPPYPSHASGAPTISTAAYPAPPVPGFTFVPPPQAPLFPSSLSSGHPPIPSFGGSQITHQPFVGQRETANPGTAQRVNAARMASSSGSAGTSSTGTSRSSGGSRARSNRRTSGRGSRSTQSTSLPQVPDTVHKDHAQVLTPDGLVKTEVHCLPPVLLRQSNGELDMVRPAPNQIVLQLQHRYSGYCANALSLEPVLFPEASIQQAHYSSLFNSSRSIGMSEFPSVFSAFTTEALRQVPTQSSIYLHPHAVTPQMTLLDLLDKRQFARSRWSNPNLAIRDSTVGLGLPVPQQEKRFVLTLQVIYPGLQYRRPDSALNVPPSIHSCLSQQFYQLFAADHLMIDARVIAEEARSECEGTECEDMSAADGDSNGMRTRPASPEVGDLGSLTLEDSVPPPTTSTRTRRRSSADNSSNVRNVRPRRDSSTQQIQDPPSASFSGDFIPPRLRWDIPFNPRFDPDDIAPAEYSLSLLDFRDSVLEGACKGLDNVPRLTVRGRNLDEASMVYESAIRDAVMQRDFTNVLSTNRLFSIQDSDDDIGSLGIGIETEILSKLLTNVESRLSSYFVSRLDDLHVINTPNRVRSLNEDRWCRIATDAAIISLSLCQGIPVRKIDGAWLIYLVHDCNFDALTYDAVEEYHPELARVVKQLHQMSHEDDLTPLADYLDIQAGIQVNLDHYRNRDQDTHTSIAPEVLYTALLGKEPPSHPYVRAFLAGFNLPCRNGFTFSKAACGFEGGPSALIRLCSSSQITGYGIIKDILEVSAAPDFTVPSEGLSALPGCEELVSFDSILRGFLQRTGIPCQAAFNEKRDAGLFSDRIPFDQINDESFRSRMFAIAISGSDSVRFDNRFKVIWGTDRNAQYGTGTPAYRALLAAGGHITWRTCFQTCIIPANYLTEQLARRPYDRNATDQPNSLQQAIDSWLLLEILTAISHHGGII